MNYKLWRRIGLFFLGTVFLFSVAGIGVLLHERWSDYTRQQRQRQQWAQQARSIIRQQQEEEKALLLRQQHQEKLLAPVVRLVAEYDTPYGQRKLRGSGVVVYSKPNQNGSGYDTYVLTANHVIETPIFNGKKIKSSKIGIYYDMTKVGVRQKVTYAEYFHTVDQQSIKVPAHVVAFSPNNVYRVDPEGNMTLESKHWSGKEGGEDLALLRLLTMERFHAVEMLPPNQVGNLQVMDKVRLVGCALADHPGSTSGEISRLTNGYMQVSAPIVFGNSGGACFLKDTDQFIGISNAMRVTNQPMGPRVPVMHMALVRPVSRIYSWLKHENHAFIYDQTISDAERFERIQQDKYTHYFAQKTEKDVARQHIRKLTERVQDLEDINDTLLDELDCLLYRFDCLEEDLWKLSKESCTP